MEPHISWAKLLAARCQMPRICIEAGSTPQRRPWFESEHPGLELGAAWAATYHYGVAAIAPLEDSQYHVWPCQANLEEAEDSI